MKIKLELFGASRDFSDKDFLEFVIENEISVKDLKKKLFFTWRISLKEILTLKKLLKLQLFVQRRII